MQSILKYLIMRIASPFAWIGLIGFILEIFLHGPYMSTLILVLCCVLFFAPADSINTLFAGWTKRVQEFFDAAT